MEALQLSYRGAGACSTAGAGSSGVFCGGSSRDGLACRQSLSSQTFNSNAAYLPNDNPCQTYHHQIPTTLKETPYQKNHITRKSKHRYPKKTSNQLESPRNNGPPLERPQIRLSRRRQLQLGRSRKLLSPRKLPRPQPQSPRRPLAKGPRPQLVRQRRRRRCRSGRRRDGTREAGARAQGGAAQDQRGRGGRARARAGVACAAAGFVGSECSRGERVQGDWWWWCWRCEACGGGRGQERARCQ